MKHIEASKLIILAKTTEAEDVRYSLIERLRGAFHVETVSEGIEKFTMTMTGKDSPYRCALDIAVKTDSQRARLMIDGNVSISSSTKIYYALGVLALLVLGLFPGTINTTGRGNATDFLVFLFLGVFVFYDMNKKLSEPEVLLDRVLNTVETEFSA